MATMRTATTFAAALSLAGCGFDDADPTSSTLGGGRTVSGQLVDYRDNAAVTGATLTVSGLTADVQPEIEIEGARFTIRNVIENSTFQIRAAAPGYYPTFGPAVVVAAADVENVRVPVVSEGYMTMLKSGFSTGSSADTGTLIARLYKAEDGSLAPGVAATNFAMTGGPHFLDPAFAPDPTATASTASGGVVFFNLPPGVVQIAQPTSPSVQLDMATSPVEAGTVTLADITVTQGEVALPTNVSFATRVYPIFAARGCVACHAASGDGKNLGNLTLTGNADKVYRELQSPGRIRLATPENSLILTMPSREAPPDRHPNITFASPKDPDYLAILVWIREGAKEN